MGNCVFTLNITGPYPEFFRSSNNDPESEGQIYCVFQKKCYYFVIKLDRFSFRRCQILTAYAEKNLIILCLVVFYFQGEKMCLNIKQLILNCFHIFYKNLRPFELELVLLLDSEIWRKLKNRIIQIGEFIVM